MHLDVIAEKIEEFENEMLSLKKRNKQLEELAGAQQAKLNSIYEEAAKEQYEAELWHKRYEAVEAYIQNKLAITPASIPYDNVRLALGVIKRYDLHELN